MAAELKLDFNLDTALQIGTVPLILKAKDPLATLATYVALYLKEEVQTEGLVISIGDFASFLKIISFSHGSVLNLNNIAIECSVSRKIIENYLSILEDLLLAHILPVFTKRSQCEVISHPKFYYFDAGVYYSLRRKGPLDQASEISGVALEGMVMQHIYKHGAISTYPEATAIVLYRGKDKLMINGIKCWPVESFLQQLIPDSFPN